MTTAITDIVNNLYTLIGDTLTAYTELPDPYAIENNTELFLKKGFAVGIAGASNEQERSETCSRWIRRTFSFTLTNKITTTRENNTAIKTIQKSIMEDQELVLQAIYDDSTLSGKAIDITYTDDTGIQYLDINDIKYFSVTSNFEILYRKQT
jgi:hypothetical protein